MATIPKGLAEKRLKAQASDPGNDSDDFKQLITEYKLVSDVISS